MLELKNITKDYLSGEQTVHALKGIDIEFRKSEFVSILGPSGCGKTTLLNIIGGLDRYTSGDLIINGKSTKKFKDRDWDAYRNHSVGFVFQNYNLIPHQSVLANVELSLTLSGIGKRERRKRAKKALEDVGLGEQINKRPNQLSGGQMQRVAIARALVNDPDIILADEPTGALDTETSVQVMEILKKISEDRLIIMVTHNPDLADKYSSRIVKAIDGKIISDSNPFTEKDRREEEGKEFKTGKTSMSFLTALSLSLNNLMTKKGRTFLTAFAGSIGIIGIALILSLSNGVQVYIDKLQQDTLSSYPLTIQEESVDMNSMFSEFMEQQDKEYDDDRIHVTSVIDDTVSMISNQVKKNNLTEFKKFLDSNQTIKDNSSDIQYGYDVDVCAYRVEDNNTYTQVNPSTMQEIQDEIQKEASNDSAIMGVSMSTSFPTADVWTELMNNQELLDSQYNVVAGHWPQNENEVVLVLSEEGKITDYSLYALGVKDKQELKDKLKQISDGKTVESSDEESFSPEDFIGTKYRILLNTDFYQKQGTRWIDMSKDTTYLNSKLANAKEVTLVGVVEPTQEAAATSATLAFGGIGYKKELTDYLVANNKLQQIAVEQKANENINVFTGLEFITNTQDAATGMEMMTKEEQMAIMNMSPEEISQLIKNYSDNANATLKGNLKKLGVCDTETPSMVSIYPKDFKSKDVITAEIEKYNQQMRDEGKDENVITYSDILKIMMNSVTTMVNMISYVLIAFVAISLVVSSIMIGIITYISVLERIKEIGILRAIGASKRDISRVFNAETVIVGFCAGIIGIGVSILLILPINLIIKNSAGVEHLAKLPVIGACILVLISMVLTTIAGLIPSKVASKKDPVEALRTE